jgi:hypothetical protein
MRLTEESQKPSFCGHRSSGFPGSSDAGYGLIHKPVSESTSQNFTASMSSGTIGGMKLLAVEAIKEFGNRWMLSYTIDDGSMIRDSFVVYNTQEEAEEIRKKLLDIVEPNHAVSINKHEQKTFSRRKHKNMTRREALDAQIEELEERAKAAFGLGRDEEMRLFFRKAQALKKEREKVKTGSRKPDS